MVSSSWLAALCRQLLCLKVTARYLGSDCGLILGRQAAWRPGTIGMVSSGWLAALCKQSLFSDCEVWALVAGFGTARCRPRHCFECAVRELRARRHTQQIPCRWQGQMFSRGRCSLVQNFCSSSEDSNDGKELLRHQRQSKRMEYTVLAGVVHLSARLMADVPRSVSCATRSRRGAQRVYAA